MAVALPTNLDEDGFYGIRLESIGGLGAHLAGQILAEAGVLGLGLNGSHFSSYGSEKKGTPVKSYIRFCSPDKTVRTSSPVERPHVIAVFHEALIGREKVALGLRQDGAIIVNSTASPAEIKERLDLPGGTIGVVDALAIALAENTRINMAMLGAVTRAAAFIDPETVKATVRDTFERRYPHLLEANLRTFQRGYDELRLQTFPLEGEWATGIARPQPAYGYLNAPWGGMVTNPGNSVLKNLTASRQGLIPAFEVAKCVHCGLCDVVCPDYCLVWETVVEDGEQAVYLRGIDYQYCKGCLKCVDACPTAALVEIRETEGYAEANRVRLFPQLDGGRS
ncbi:MAG: 2-oxoacid:acceptor oxidoreductase family protein [Chloroflexota bacterium]|nr:2-oxoacid:acceptor oxidoreductase family protein [Chloroflexota bacterium]